MPSFVSAKHKESLELKLTGSTREQRISYQQLSWNWLKKRLLRAFPRLRLPEILG